MHLISHSFVVAINLTLLLTSIVFILEIRPAFYSQKLQFSSSLMPFSHLYVPLSDEIVFWIRLFLITIKIGTEHKCYRVRGDFKLAMGRQ